MATTDASTTTTKQPAAKRKAATAKRKPAATKRAPAAKQATRTTARGAAASSTQPATRVARVQQIAERAVLIPVGAALEARDRVAGTVSELVATTRSRSALEHQLTRFERRGGSARTQLEREVRKTRTRLERETRQARHGLERRGKLARRTLGSNVEGVSGRVENVVQNGVNAGIKLVNGAQDRIAKAA